MNNLLNYITSGITISSEELNLVKKYFTEEEVTSQHQLLKAGNTENYIYFLSKGIVKGYQNHDGKIVIQHLITENDFFTSLDSFTHQTPTLDYYETVTECKLVKISTTNFDLLQNESDFWGGFVKVITNEHLNCKLDRVKDFQTLSAKERYLKFISEYPNLVLNVSIENIASFLGMEPQSLSRIRKQITF